MSGPHGVHVQSLAERAGRAAPASVPLLPSPPSAPDPCVRTDHATAQLPVLVSVWILTLTSSPVSIMIKRSSQKVVKSLLESKLFSAFSSLVCSGWYLVWVDPLEPVLLHMWPRLPWPYSHLQAAQEWRTDLPWPHKTNQVLQHCCLPRWIAYLLLWLRGGKKSKYFL